ncbi:hypothetical protein B0A49_09313 [Cryomyces minteri]|uniref:Uncharacterized protein n=1 Tax=Cryomyces minteri TaxID=331657 RepID=A0A4U0WI09_9PEZI|nr:hypothetical protein B0A49_11045 [Cryomyces minteri]TKA65961.1 hypothetical protein B0A49_09313 [Cryomyces minteri]
MAGGSHDKETGFGSNPVTALDQQCLALSTRSHDSRVWSVRFVSPEETAENAPLATIISAGEDATCRTWQLSAVAATENPGPAFRIQHIGTSAHHAGKNIWSLAVHGNEQVATGGADGRIVLASMTTNEECAADSVSRQEEWTLEEALSTVSARAEPRETREVSGLDNKRSSVDLAQGSAEAHPSRHIADAPAEAPETKKKKTKKSPKPTFDSFRTYAFVSEKSILATTSAGVVMLATMENRGLRWQELGQNSDLRGYSVTTGVNSMGIGLLAGTDGSLYYYDDRTEQLQSIVTRQDGKTSAILAEPVVSAEGDQEALSVVHTTPFGPHVEGVHIEPATDTLVFYGFRSKQFVVYNENNDEEIMAVECGGAHRNWSFNPTPKWTGGTFVWTKASKLNLVSQPEAAHRTYSTHGQLIATGAEDTDVRISAYDTRSRKGFRCLRILRKHVTGVQKLQWSQDGRHLFSCGGFEEFFVWRVRSVPAIGVGVVCESVCPPGVERPDLRIMSFSAWQEEAAVAGADAELERDAEFLITMAYSDSTVKIFRYTSTPARKHWQLLLTGNYLTSCLTQSAYLLQSPHFVLATTSTDGHLALWTLGAPLTHSRDAAAVVVPRAAAWQVRLRIHQSTIKCMAEHLVDANTWLLVTGGDDNALALTRIDSIDREIERATLPVPSAHAAAVTALAVIPGLQEPVQGRRHLRVVTSSNDQRIKVWAVSVDPNRRGVDGIAVEKVHDIFTPVADVSSMEVMEDDGSGARVLLCGVGMDLWRLSG